MRQSITLIRTSCIHISHSLVQQNWSLHRGTKINTMRTNPEDFLWAFHENFYPQNSLLYGKFLPTPYIDWIQRCGVRSVKRHSCQVDVCVSPQCPAGPPGPHWRGAVVQHQYDLWHWHTWGQLHHSEEHSETEQYCHSDEHGKTIKRCVLAVKY